MSLTADSSRYSHHHVVDSVLPHQRRTQAVDKGDVFWTASTPPVVHVDFAASPRIGEVSTCGMTLHPMSASEVVDEIVIAAVVQEKILIANHNLHSLHLLLKDRSLERFYSKAHRVLIDGAPILWLAKARNRFLTAEHRVGSTDWLRPLLPRMSEAGLRLAFVAGAPGVAERAKDEIVARYPEIDLHVHDGYFDSSVGSSDNSRVLQWIRDTAPDVLLVGMGMPRQERWIDENFDDIEATVICTVGGCVDYIGGAQELAPRWLGKLGLEWLHRLANNPARLWRRYLVEGPATLLLLLLRNLALPGLRRSRL